MKRSFPVQILLIHLNADDFCEKHFMRSERQNPRDLAFQTDRRLQDHRRLYVPAGCGSKMTCLKLVDVPSALTAAEICSPGKSAVCQIDHKFAGFLYNLVGITLRPDRNRYHGRIGADGAGPCDGQNIVAAFLGCTAHHDRRYRIQKIARFFKWYLLCFTAVCHRFPF